MMRVLTMIAISGFLLCVVCISGAVAIGGPEAIERGVWNWGGGSNWGWNWSDGGRHGHGRWAYDGRYNGPQTTRTLSWTGSDTLDLQAPADVTFTQGTGPASVTVTGPSNALDALELEDGRLMMRDHGFWQTHAVKVVMTAPGVHRFILSGAGKLDVENYNADELDLDVSGAGSIRAHGAVKTLKLDISGTGSADLSELKDDAADVSISGMGHARVAPTTSAKVDISGLGEVNLETRPKQLETHVSGMGHVHQPNS